MPLLLVGCTAELESRMDNFEERLSKLETLCSQMNTNISSLQTIVTALQNNDYVTSVTPVMKGSEEIGYTIAFTKSKAITIYHGTDGKNGADGKDGKDGINGTNGKDGSTPVIGVAKHTDGLYYWTLNGDWMHDNSGNMIRAVGTDGKDGADGKDGKDGQNGSNGTDGQDGKPGADGKDGKDGITPQLKIENKYWYISYDNGETWTQLQKAVGEDGQNGENGKDGDAFFKSVDTSNPSYVTFTLANGTVIELPRNNSIVSQIKAITYVPSYSDNIAYVICMGSEKTLEMTFRINPTNLTKQIAASWKEMLELEVAYNTMTKAPMTTTLDILSVEVENGYLDIVASGDKLNRDFLDGKSGASVSLKIEKGEAMLASEFIQILPKYLTDLSGSGSANSYIVSEAGLYGFSTVQGNSSNSVGDVAFVEVLWESFGTDTAPSIGDLVKNANIFGSYITFEATDKKGNALIAAKDATGKILWSWHIWMTDKPEDQVYYNNAGTMMDRNLGATSATPGDVGALGLLYQWGRKDPFLGGSAISYSSWENQAKAASTLTWPEAVISDATTGTITYAQEHPTTFIKYNSSPYDWHYGSRDNTLWQSSKTIYDPCPPGYRVPDGDSYGVWSKALGSSSSFTDKTLYNSTTRGFNFYGKFGDASTIWYPLSGYLLSNSGQLNSGGRYWSITPVSDLAYSLGLNSIGSVSPSNSTTRACGLSVRCLQE